MLSRALKFATLIGLQEATLFFDRLKLLLNNDSTGNDADVGYFSPWSRHFPVKASFFCYAFVSLFLVG